MKTTIDDSAAQRARVEFAHDRALRLLRRLQGTIVAMADRPAWGSDRYAELDGSRPNSTDLAHMNQKLQELSDQLHNEGEFGS